MLQVGSRTVGAGAPCLVIAEAGVNHNGDVALAHKLVDAAADAGADAIKFQTFEPQLLASAAAATATYQKRTGHADQAAMLEALDLPRWVYPALRDHARDRGLEFLSTPFDAPSVDFLADLGVPAFKISSGDLTNHLLLRHVARQQRPILMSAGMADLAEIRAAADAIRQIAEVPLAVLHCVSSYPAPAHHCNLLAIPRLAGELRVPIGYSDHTLGTVIALGAVALGAVIIEKHLTLDVALPGPDHHISATPAGLATLVAGVRELQSALGHAAKEITSPERESAALGRRSLHWAESLPEGTIVAESHLIALRPAGGLGPERWAELVGRRLARDVVARERVAPGDVR